MSSAIADVKTSATLTEEASVADYQLDRKEAAVICHPTKHYPRRQHSFKHDRDIQLCMSSRIPNIVDQSGGKYYCQAKK